MREEIIETIRKALYLKPDQVNNQTLIDDVAKDSMDMIELVAILSEKYNIAIEPNKMNHIKTIEDFVNYVLENTGSLPARA